MKNYLVIDNGFELLRTNDLNELIREIYEGELEAVELTAEGHIHFFEEIKKRFFREYEVFVSESEIVKLEFLVN